MSKKYFSKSVVPCVDMDDRYLAVDGTCPPRGLTRKMRNPSVGPQYRTGPTYRFEDGTYQQLDWSDKRKTLQPAVERLIGGRANTSGLAAYFTALPFQVMRAFDTRCWRGCQVPPTAMWGGRPLCCSYVMPALRCLPATMPSLGAASCTGTHGTHHVHRLHCVPRFKLGLPCCLGWLHALPRHGPPPPVPQGATGNSRCGAPRGPTPSPMQHLYPPPSSAMTSCSCRTQRRPPLWRPWPWGSLCLLVLGGS
jgi:hypothetical protein